MNKEDLKKQLDEVDTFIQSLNAKADKQAEAFKEKSSEAVNKAFEALKQDGRLTAAKEKIAEHKETVQLIGGAVAVAVILGLGYLATRAFGGEHPIDDSKEDGEDNDD